MSTTTEETTEQGTEDIDAMQAHELDGPEMAGAMDAEAANPTTDGGFALAQPYAVPADDAFHGKEFLQLRDLAAMASEIKSQWPGDFRHIPSMGVGYYWRRKGTSMMGRAEWYGTRKASGLEAATLNIEFVVWIAADYARETPVTRAEVCNALVHCLLHIGENETDGHLKYRGHDFEGFRREVELIGMWNQTLEEVGETFWHQERAAAREAGDDPDAPVSLFDEIDDDADEPDFTRPPDDGVEDSPAYMPHQPVGALPGLEAHLAQHPEQIEALERSAGDGPNDLTETIATAKRGRRGRTAGDVAEGAQAT